MLKIHHVAAVVLAMLLYSGAPSAAQVSVGIGFPGVNIGINLPAYPRLVRVPGYPVYYAPQLDANFFFYDGMYWVFQNDDWYTSSWYNGPWGLVNREDVPLFVLRVPVRYYRQPPAYFRGMAGRMHRRVGVTIGAMTGNSVEAGGINGTVARFRDLPRCHYSSGAIQEIAIPDKWSSSTSFSSGITVTSHVTPQCDNTIRARVGIREGVLTRNRVGIGVTIRAAIRAGVGIAIINAS